MRDEVWIVSYYENGVLKAHCWSTEELGCKHMAALANKGYKCYMAVAPIVDRVNWATKLFNLGKVEPIGHGE